MKRRALYICYYDLGEPLVESQVVAYLRQLAKRDYDIHLLTFERKRLSTSQAESARDGLARAGITWHHLRYHQRPSLPATLFDIAVGTVAAARICSRHDIEVIHARSHVPAAMAWTLKKLFGYGFIFDYRGMLAEEYVDGGHWREDGIKFRLTKAMERRFFRNADAFVMLTNRIKRDLVASETALHARSEDIEVIPCCVDTARFDVNHGVRASYRKARGWDNRIVLTYVGKIGLWYMVEEMARFFAVARTIDPRFFFQVLTQSDQKQIRDILWRLGVPEDSYDIRIVSSERLPEALLGSDAGISLIRACNSKRASSPTKVAEYLAAGLPVVLNTGVGDCDELVERNRVGVALDGFTDGDFADAVRALIGLLNNSDLRTACRETAEREFSLAGVGANGYEAVYDRLLGKQGIGRSATAVETV